MASQYGALERRIARVLSDFPLVKSWVKLAYAHTVYHLSGGRETATTGFAPVREVGADDTETFFGYYDSSPLSAHGWLLCHAASHSSTRRPHPARGLAVQVFDFGRGDLIHPVLSVQTSCYNWQQGARAQWLDGDHFIFNDYDPQRQRYISRVHSVASRKEVQRYDHPVQSAWQRNCFLALNYRRLQALRPDYGYLNLAPLDAAELARLDNDGIWLVDQASGASRLLYTLQDVCDTAREPGFQQARHKVNHIMIAPDGQHFIFLHRYFPGKRKVDRLMLGKMDGSGLRVLSAHGMVSHCFWLGDTRVLCYARGPSGSDGYYIVDTTTTHMTSVLGGALDAMGDGHPHVHGDWFVSDSYPDRRRMQHLFRVDLHKGRAEELGRFHHSFRYRGQTRCDLHPRITPDGRHVFFDSVDSGRRRLCFVEIRPQGVAPCHFPS